MIPTSLRLTPLLLIIQPVGVPAAPPQVPAAVVRGGVGETVDTYLERAVPFGFRGAVSLEVEGEFVLQSGYGVRRDGSRVRGSTPFPIASLAKSFTAGAVLLLVAEDRLSLTDPIGGFFDIGPDKAAITVEQLLTHRSGLVGDLEPSLAPDAALEDAFGRPLDFEPGTETRYSNVGYHVAAMVVERVSGRPFGAFLKRRVFKPLGLRDTRIKDPVTWGRLGPSGIVSTAPDLARWVRALESGSGFLPDALLARMVQPTEDGYGLGWRVSESSAFGTIVWHNGDGGSVSTSIRRYVDRRVNVVYLDDTRVRDAVLNRVLLPALGREIRFPPISTGRGEDLERLVGTFQGPAGHIRVWLEEGALWIGGLDQTAINELAALPDPQREEMDAVSGRSLDILTSLGGGDMRPLVGAFNPRIPGDVVEDAIGEEWAAFRNAHGPFDRIELLGSEPNRSIVYTYARLHFASGSEVYRIQWGDGVIDGIRASAELDRGAETLPRSRRFVRGEGDSWVTYDLATEESLAVRFTDAEGTILILGGDAPRSRWSARRGRLPGSMRGDSTSR